MGVRAVGFTIFMGYSGYASSFCEVRVKTENAFVLPLERRNGEDAILAALLGLFDEDMDNLFLCARNISLTTSTLMS